MWCAVTFVYIFLTNLSLSHAKSHHPIQSRDDHDNTDILNANCGLQYMNVGLLKTKFGSNDQRISKNSFSKPVSLKDQDTESGETDDHSPSLNHIQVLFTIPFNISNIHILNQTVFITDPISDQVIPSVLQICINSSTFIINYTTKKSLPHNVCLYLSLLTTPLKEFYLCRTINDNSSLDHDDHNDHNEDHAMGPSAIFIISQCVIICIMMLFIYATESARKKHVINCISTHFRRQKTIPRVSTANILNATLDQRIRGNENQLNNFIPINTEAQVLTTLNNRRFTNHTLIDITELARRLSITNKHIESNIS